MKEFLLYSDERLMQEIKADNLFAFDILYKKYCTKLYRFGFSIVKSEEEAENLVQDVFLNLWENRYKVKKDASVKYYLFSIAYNSAVSIIRKKSRESRFIEYMMSQQVVNQEPVNIEVEYTELTDKLNEIVDRLPGRQKKVYILHKVEGLKYREIAERLNISVNTIENHMSRARKTIRLKLGDYSPVTLLFLFMFV
jgi:RNA polymerase sigma-70 factor (family 1)